MFSIVRRIKIARVAPFGITVPVRMNTQTGHHFAALFINHARRRMVCQGRLKKVIVRECADQHAGLTRLTDIAPGLRQRNVEAAEPNAMPSIEAMMLAGQSGLS